MSDEALHNLVSRLVEAEGDIGEEDEDSDEVVQVLRLEVGTFAACILSKPHFDRTRGRGTNSNFNTFTSMISCRYSSYGTRTIPVVCELRSVICDATVLGMTQMQA